MKIHTTVSDSTRAASLWMSRDNQAVGETWEEKCRVQVPNILARRGWHLADGRDEFVRAVCEEVVIKPAPAGEELSSTAIERATIHHYCIVLYDSCSETGGSRQRDAFSEIHKHLYRIALFKTHDAETAQDCVQQALLNIWKYLDQCRDKGSFLNWCNLILINAIREHFRKSKKAKTEEGGEWMSKEVAANAQEVLKIDTELEPSVQPILRGGSEGFERVHREELLNQLVSAIRACLKNEQQQTVIIELFLNDKTFKQVADQLGTTPGNVQVMKSRAMKVLRDCDKFIRIYEEWLK